MLNYVMVVILRTHLRVFLESKTDISFALFFLQILKRPVKYRDAC